MTLVIVAFVFLVHSKHNSIWAAIILLKGCGAPKDVKFGKFFVPTINGPRLWSFTVLFWPQFPLSEYPASNLVLYFLHNQREAQC